jgi:UTP-glucose-1-phosphate uridylyltransferase
MSIKIDNKNVSSVVANGILKGINGNSVVIEDAKTGDQDKFDINSYLQEYIEKEVKITITNKEVLAYTTE